jgi:2-hydroxychromene-2-carboxylate isomerase
MGQVIYLNERRSERSGATADNPPAFFFDVSCPLSYLTAERVERRLGVVEWVPVYGAALRRAGGDDGPNDAHNDAAAHDAVVCARADAVARALRLPLVWPDRFPATAVCAQRAAAFACELGAGSAFVLAMSRLAFCGGFDLDDPETLAEAAAAAGVPLDECLTAAGETWRDEELQATAVALRARGITELPAIRVGREWFQGESGLLAAGALLHEPRSARGLRRSAEHPPPATSSVRG